MREQPSRMMIVEDIEIWLLDSNDLVVSVALAQAPWKEVAEEYRVGERAK